MIVIRAVQLFLLAALIYIPVASKNIIFVKPVEGTHFSGISRYLARSGEGMDVCFNAAWSDCYDILSLSGYRVLTPKPKKIIANWQGFWVSDDGKLIDSRSELLKPKSVVESKGDDIDVARVVTMIVSLQGSGLQLVEIDRWGAVEIEFKGEIRAKLGRKIQLIRSKTAAKLAKKLMNDASSQKIILDMRYPSGYSMKKV